ncbi:MAG: hypothetical protein LBT40_15155 [Deltaproteobacteria bacterium]|nr:hypothetical protein [Deltaproteobacteria bacterium]
MSRARGGSRSVSLARDAPAPRRAWTTVSASSVAPSRSRPDGRTSASLPPATSRALPAPHSAARAVAASGRRGDIGPTVRPTGVPPPTPPGPGHVRRLLPAHPPRRLLPEHGTSAAALPPKPDAV